LGADAKPQDLVQVYQQATSTGNSALVSAIFCTGVLIAPLSEELLFRGFFYPVLKRPLGPVLSGILTSGLFAAMHLNALSFAGLLVLALCLTIAYEWSGSLVVPVAMHMGFNAISLLAMLLPIET
jgi:membrane protease YdiL (CAAX protease family)